MQRRTKRVDHVRSGLMARCSLIIRLRFGEDLKDGDATPSAQQCTEDQLSFFHQSIIAVDQDRVEPLVPFTTRIVCTFVMIIICTY